MRLYKLPGLLLILVAAFAFAGLASTPEPAAADGPTIQEQVVPFLDILTGNAATVLDTSPAVLQNELAVGRTLAQIAAERGLQAGFGPQFQQAVLGDIDTKVASGDLSSDSANDARALFTSSLNDIINAPYINDTGEAAAAAASAPAGPTTPMADENSPGGNAPPRHLTVVATTVQVTALTKAVAGDLLGSQVDLTGIIPAGADPHSFEPVPSDLVAITNADLVLRNGIGLDDWLDKTLQAGAAAQVATVTKGVSLRLGNNNGQRESDPHVWHDPANAKIMTDNIASAMAALDPGDAGVYLANAGAEDSKLDAVKSQGLSLVATLPADGRKLVTSHDAFSYFARAFGFQIVGAVIPGISTEAEPSAKDLANLEDAIKREHVKAVFAESSVNPALAKSVAGDTGAKIVTGLYGDSLGPDGSADASDTVEGMIMANIRSIVNALE